MKTIVTLLGIIAIVALWYDARSQRSALAETQSQLVRVTQERDAMRQGQRPLQQPIPPTPWGIPRTITTLNGQVFANATILRVYADGAVTINFGPTAIKLPNGSLNAATMRDILAAQPSTPKTKTVKPTAEPTRSGSGPPVSSLGRVGLDS